VPKTNEQAKYYYIVKGLKGIYVNLAPISEGTVKVEDAGNGNYTFTFNLVDDGGNTITGEWTGIVNVDDLSDEIAGATSSVALPLAVRR
jgi:hypothetical protein